MAKEPTGFLRGKVAIEPLSGFKPNAWNPNRMTPRMMRAMVDGLRRDGWLVSQALLVWGIDDRGVARNVIIDGEHRYRAALETGLTEGPVVRLDGITEAQAKALTVKMNQKRGDFDSEMLSELMRGIQYDDSLLRDDSDLSLMFGFEQEEMMRLLAEPEPALELKTPKTSPVPSSGDQPARDVSSRSDSIEELPASDIKMVRLFFNVSQHEEYIKLIRSACNALGTDNPSDATILALRSVTKSSAKG